MTVSQDDIYTQIQDLFRGGIVTVVGSGASCAYGLPSMSDLADHLIATVSARTAGAASDVVAEWEAVRHHLADGIALEAALGPVGLSESLLEIVADEIARCVIGHEKTAIETVLSGDDISPFGRLFTHLLRASTIADVVTTNYDRLVEVHAARADVRVDSMFYGHTVGRFSPALSKGELSRSQNSRGRRGQNPPAVYPHLRISKPHGSLDWYTVGRAHYRTDLGNLGARRIIAPGGSKYRLGYEAPFDAHRNRANDAIDNAKAMLFIGYGFNDEHLQTHVRSRFPEVRSLIISKRLTQNAKEFLAMNAMAIGVEEDAVGSGCVVSQGSEELELDVPLWDLDCLLKEVLAV